ncbi:MAG: DUF1553 domain-containing protein [Planctomycetes bacterium]|nr:DUF1553 domain-containing protein [Planctomycetota bacterium]
MPIPSRSQILRAALSLLPLGVSQPCPALALAQESPSQQAARPQEPKPPTSPKAASDASFPLEQRRATHWAWQPLLATAPPPDVPRSLVRDPLDAFVVHRLHEAGLEPSPPAAPHTLLRRLWFDLAGVPPPAEVLADFLRDPSDAAYDRQVDNLLASPQFGERWGRHWLDLVRFAETLGHEYDFPIPNAWRYRDYVIRAINADVPYDQFVREHIAGDLLPAPRRSATGENESVQATAAWWFAEQTHSPVDAGQHESDRIDNQIDVLGKAVLGLTVACARCHDHKFDAIRSADYYALFGFVKSSRYVQAPLQPCDVAGEPYSRALALQRAFATTWWQAAVNAENASPRWRDLGKTPPERWSAGGGVGPVRAGDRVIATADDPRTDDPTDGWLVTNDGFGPAPWRGPWCPDPTAEQPELWLLPGTWWHSGIAGTAREGVLQTRTFPLDQRYVHVRVAGRDSRIKVIVDGFNIVRDPIYGELHKAVNKPFAHWVTFDTGMWQGRPAYVQCIDQRAQDLGDPNYETSPYPQNGWLAVQMVVTSNEPSPPPTADGLDLPPRPWSEVAPAVLAKARQLAEAEAALPVSAAIPALSDGTGTDEPVHLRGSYRMPGAIANRRFLEALDGDSAMATGPGSGRLQLASAILAADNPLPARVLCNRVWHHLFGRGLVKSVDNLGSLGDRPSDPELLDWLARDFTANGWSLKHVVARVVRSATYRQDSRTGPAAASIDADNVLLHRQNVRRLEAEAVRDALLAISGSLQPTMYGPSIPIPLDSDHEARGKPAVSGPIDGDGRRSIYLALHRNFMPPMLQAFDLPTPFATVGARNVSNVPAQALTLLNDPFVHLMCERWAERLPSRNAEASNLDRVYELAFARPPRADERQRCREFLSAAAAERNLPDDDPHVWADLLHCLVNTKEFAFRR